MLSSVYLCMHACMYVCTYVCMLICTHVRIYVFVLVCLHVCMYSLTHVCFYTCKYTQYILVCIHIIYLYTHYIPYLYTLLLWLRSFLTERSLRVVHGSSRSSWVPAVFGLPQGSVLAPLLFIIYTSDLLTLPLALPLMLCSPNCMQMMFRPTSTATPLMVPRPTGL